MKFNYNKALIFLLLLNLVYNYSIGQEEFFKDHNGITASYGQVLSDFADPIHAASFSMYLYNGVFFSPGVEVYNLEKLYKISAGYYFKHTTNSKPFLALTYAKAENSQIFAPTLGGSRIFFYNSNFPFSISSSASILTEFKPDNNSTVQFGFGYNQTFFKNNRLYPLLGFQFLSDLNLDVYFYAINIGLNVEL